ncbi:MAG TPA: response regulator [Ferrovibrio sp.]|uniref:PhyR family response regulator anti-anti-sigma factor n=1 Tax=Ferrovibrio sp. TaxID=1917215 RepID=UPI002ED2A901
MIRLMDTIKHQVPYLRRYARALCWDPDVADAYVCSAIDRLIEMRGSALSSGKSIRLQLYRSLSDILMAKQITADPRFLSPHLDLRMAHKCLASLPLQNRQAVLLSALEDFSLSEIGYILGLAEDEIAKLISTGNRKILKSVYTDILIIEDEAVIAYDLSAILRELGHKVLPVASTKAEAIRSASSHNPGLILADIELADESSGLDAVHDIWSNRMVPAIFITAYPERVVPAGRPDYSVLLTKPYEPESVKGAVSRALFLAPGR